MRAGQEDESVIGSFGQRRLSSENQAEASPSVMRLPDVNTKDTRLR